MDQSTLLSIIGALIAILLAIVAWFGKGMSHKIDAIPDKVGVVVKDIYEKLGSHSERLTVIETRCEISHGEERRRVPR